MSTIEFNLAITNHYSSLALFTNKFTKNEEDSRDLIQETIMKALSNRNKFKKGTNIKAWLFTIMRNTFINSYRKNKNRKTFNDITESEFFLNKKDDHTFNNPIESYNYNELQLLVDSLPEKIKIPFQLYCQGFKYDEIAEKGQVPIGTVKNRIFQARKQVQQMMVA